MIPHGGLFSAKNKATLESPKDFFNFVKACKALDTAEQKCQITLIEKDPKVIAQKERALKNLKRSGPSGSDNVEAEPSPGATLSCDVVKNIRAIRARYHARPELTGSNEVPVYMHPYKKGYFLRLDHNRVGVWAIAMTENPEVTLSKPPDSPSFEFEFAEPRETPKQSPTKSHSALDSPTNTGHYSGSPFSPFPPAGFPAMPNGNNSPSAARMQHPPYPSMPYPMGYGLPYAYPGVHQPGMMYNHMGPPMPHMAVPYPLPQMYLSAQSLQTAPHAAGRHAFPTELAANNAPPSSPTGSDDQSSVDDYLRFTKVNPCYPDVSKGINVMEITHYSAFAKFKEINFEKRGIKPAPSRLMTSCVGKYKRHLKRAKENSQSTLH
ncbi:hypothetical protein PCANC_20419 [Puccinia coronata f. sp. avenae]|uniref:Uncharacterized protein n=1 Tax=Puccinia coronata f. sp. avenae TaxID=200324 RepID=A0A2N5SMZ5_9BASI|nr:hypothetical protein PCANC_20419 [Puccinia coronata f. sp. avenae]